MENRIKKLRLKMKEALIDALFVSDEKNMHYLSGFYMGEGYLVIKADSLILVTDSRYTEYAAANCTLYEVKNIRDVRFSDFVSPGEVCGFEDKKISYSLYCRIKDSVAKLTPVGDMIDSLRYIKDEGEISLIKKAAAISDKAYSHILEFIKIGVSEKDIAAELDWAMRKYGGERSSFSSIAASGKNASLPHAIPGDKKIESGDFIVLDFGCVAGGYCSDMTRTVAVGNISDEKIKIYNSVLEAQLKALSYLKAGVMCSDADNIAREFLDSCYPGAFSHSLGHSVGLDIHESPNLSPREKAILAPGMVVTVEPGVYLEQNTGVRIEDLVLVLDNGIEILSKSSKQLTILE